MILKRPLVLFAACILTPAASGDDLNLLRIATPSAFAQAPVGSFPQDDPNADFLGVQVAQAPQNDMWSSSTNPSNEKPARSMAGTLPAASALDDRIQNCVIVPLRC